MVCPSCAHIFHIKEGIPNMVSTPFAPRRPRYVPLTLRLCLSSSPSTRFASRSGTGTLNGGFYEMHCCIAIAFSINTARCGPASGRAQGAG